MNERIRSVDRLRGLVMILMAIDHVRDFIGPGVAFRGIDVEATGAPLFLTRWITHFCAPVFVLLAGVSAGLMREAGKSVSEVRKFLVTRGLFLVLLELTLIRFAWSFDVSYHATFLGVIWVLGWSMVLLTLFVGARPSVALGFGLVLVLGHDALDAVRADSLGAFGPWFAFLHEPHAYPITEGYRFFILYPLVPWVGVMAIGFGVARSFVLPARERDRRLWMAGFAMLGVFVVLRGLLNVYADPRPWAEQRTPLLTLLSVLDCTKYPPSLAYLTMTLGPAAFALIALERLPQKLGAPLEWLGRAPLFYYVLHLYLAHLGAFALYGAVYGARGLAFAAGGDGSPRFSLPVVYAATAVVVIVLVPACRWFGELKRRRRDLTILSYF